MTVKECYEAMDGDYGDVLSRLRTDERIRKFLIKILSDQSYSLLCQAIDERNVEEAFRMAHTLKGISQNLSLTPLYHSSARLSDLLRDCTEYGDDVGPVMRQLSDDYARIEACIRLLAD